MNSKGSMFQLCYCTFNFMIWFQISSIGAKYRIYTKSKVMMFLFNRISIFSINFSFLHTAASYAQPLESVAGMLNINILLQSYKLEEEQN